MLRIRKALIAGAFAGMAVVGTLAGTAVAGPGQGGGNETPPGCTKVEFPPGAGATYLVPAGVIVTIKAGNETFTFGPFAVPTLVTVPTGKDISYIITCPGPTTPPPSPSVTVTPSPSVTVTVTPEPSPSTTV